MSEHTSEWYFYEVMHRTQARRVPYPMPWWVQMYLRRWRDAFDGGLFDSREISFASNALYRYWNMVGVKDAEEESLIGQAGEVEPVYDEYSLSFFLFDPATREMFFPQCAWGQDNNTRPLTQRLEDGYLPVIVTEYHSPPGIDVREKVLATTVGVDQRAVALVRFSVTNASAAARDFWFCATVMPAGPTGFHRHDKARNMVQRQLSLINYVVAESRVKVNGQDGPLFDAPPTWFGTYGNGGSLDPEHYIDNGPFLDLQRGGVSTDSIPRWTPSRECAAGSLPGR